MKRLSPMLLLLAVGCSEPTTPADRETDGHGSSGSSSSGPDAWLPSNSSTQADKIKITLTQTGVEPIHVYGVQDLGEVFAVRLSLDNLDPTKRGNYETWANNAQLSDNFGNSYKRLPRPKDMGVSLVTLDPTVTVSDILLFEPPIHTAGYVDLNLPSGNIRAKGDVHFRIQLRTSGARLDAVTKAAAAAEAEAKARIAAISEQADSARRAAEAAKRESDQKKAEAELEAERIRSETARKKAEAALEAERIRAAAEQKRREAELEAELNALPGKLSTAKSSLEEANARLKAISLAPDRYPFTSATPPEDYFTAKGKYIWFTRTQKAARTKEFQDRAKLLTAEIANIEPRIKK